MIWWPKAVIKQEQSKMMELLGLVELKLIKCEARLDASEQAIKVLRGFVNKKVGIEPDEDEEPEILEDSDGFDTLRNLRKQFH